LIGTLSLLRFQPFDPYTADDQIFFQNLANRAALAIENARLYLAEAQRARELDALHTATTALLTTLDLEALLGYILDAAMSAIPAAEGGSLHLIARDTGQLQVRAVHGYSDPRIRKFSLPGSKGYAARAVRERKSSLIADLQEETGILEDSGFSDTNAARSVIVAPLLVGEHVLGAIALDSPKVGAFGGTDLRLLVSFATTTTTAIQNATLHSEVQKQAITDTLTGLYNRRGFFELSQREIDRVRRFGHPLSAIMLDIDHFKLVNDTYTHAVGDEVLRLLAERLRNSLREVDILGRYGGEEFVILLPETDLFGACTIAERLRKSVEETGLTTSTGPISITVSLGVTRATPSTTDLSELLNQADIALYAAKQAGRNRVEVG
jgi:diguanylate cyclase (GGDEF)-like protein